MNKTFAVMTLGCKVNDYESTYIKSELLKDYKLVDFKDKADIYIIFSCCVTNTAEAKTRKFIHQARRNNPDGYIVVIGCLAQIKPNLEDFNEVNLIIGSTLKDKAVQYIKENVEGNKVQSLDNANFELLNLDTYPGKDRAFLKIEDGCNQFCAYCTIPYARGRERSADHIKIIEQAKKLSENFNEIVLTGIHTGRYNDNGYKLIDLLNDLINIEKLKTIRLSSIEITEINDEIIELMANNDKIARHLHIPVQSASNAILKSMHRPYTIDEFIGRVEYIRDKIKDISISTDLIVGFPGENDELFEETINNLNKIQFSFIHCFPYSRKTGTVADKMDNHIDPKIKKERAKIVSNIEKPISFKYQMSLINKNVDVLIERNINNKSYGYCKQYVYIELEGTYEIGSLVKARIVSVSSEKVIAQCV